MPYIANPLEGIPLVNTFITDQDELGATPATDDKLIIFDESATALKQLTISELQASVLVSPAFTGTPTAPTQSAGNDTTRLATTAFVTAATTALNTVTEMTDVTISSIGSGEVLKWNGSAWINQELAEANILTVAGPTFTGVLTVGSAVISEADLELIDDLTAGTVVVSKAVTVDGNKDVGTIRNLTIDGIFTDGNYTFATDGSVTGLGTVASGTHTIGSLVVAAASITDTSGAISFGNENLTTTGTMTALAFHIGSAMIVEAELELIDNIDSVGTVYASKAVTVDSNKDVGTIRNLTIDGVFTDGNYTFATDGNVSGLGTVASGAITSSGIIKTDSTTNATSITDGSLQTDGGLSVALDVILGDDLTLISDAAILNFGVNSDVNLTHVHDTGLLLNSSRKIQFGDAGTFIHQSADGVLTIESDTTVDINGAVVLNGAITGATDITLSGELDAATGDFSSNVDIAGTLTMSGDTLDMSGEDIDNIKSATFIAEVANGATGGTMTIDWGAGQKQSVVLSNNTAFTFTAPDGPCNLMLKVTHAANTTTYTPTWAGGSTNVDWPAATAPTFTQTSGSVDMVTFYYDGTNANGTYFGQASLAFA